MLKMNADFVVLSACNTAAGDKPGAEALSGLKYEAVFRENEIDETVLPSLTHETLKELGVTAIGHRLKLLDAFAALRTDAGLRVDQATPSVAPNAVAKWPNAKSTANVL